MRTFESRAFPSLDAMLQAIARKWLAEQGVATSKRTPIMAAECALAWRLQEIHMEIEGYEIDDLTRAFAQVMAADGRDRRSGVQRGAIFSAGEILQAGGASR